MGLAKPNRLSPEMPFLSCPRPPDIPRGLAFEFSPVGSLSRARVRWGDRGPVDHVKVLMCCIRAVETGKASMTCSGAGSACYLRRQLERDLHINAIAENCASIGKDATRYEHRRQSRREPRPGRFPVSSFALVPRPAQEGPWRLRSLGDLITGFLCRLRNPVP
jgi:hypothetical protein